MNKVYACSDLHGRLDIWNNIKKELDLTDILYFLGDACDRGKDGWKIIKDLMDMPNIIYLLGNHELLFYESFYGPYKKDAKELHLLNYGQATVDGYNNDINKNKISYLKKINNLPVEATYRNKNNILIHLSHTGNYTDELKDDVINSIVYEEKKFEFVTNNINNYIENNSKYDLLVHGHTPVELLKQDLEHFYKYSNDIYINKYIVDEILWSFNSKKVDIDCGAFWKGYSILLDLDSLEYKKIYGNN